MQVSASERKSRSNKPNNVVPSSDEECSEK